MKEKTIKRGDLFYYDFGDNAGSVQSGERPVLVLQANDYNRNAPTVIVAALTSPPFLFLKSEKNRIGNFFFIEKMNCLSLIKKFVGEYYLCDYVILLY